jgi:hypothetical protein
VPSLPAQTRLAGGHATCSICREGNRAASAERYHARRAEGLCVRCGERADGYLCDEHSAARTERRREIGWHSGPAGNALMAAPRITQRIPREQRKRRAREVTLSPEAEAVLATLPPRDASAYVDRAVLELAAREDRKARRKSERNG